MLTGLRLQLQSATGPPKFNFGSEFVVIVPIVGKGSHISIQAHNGRKLNSNGSDLPAKTSRSKLDPNLLPTASDVRFF